jgi:hypothetical protein
MTEVVCAAGLAGVKFETDFINPKADVPAAWWGYLGVQPYGPNVEFDRAYGHKPSAGPKDALGNRDCYHFHYSGQIRIIPKGYSSATRVRNGYREMWILNESTPSSRRATMSTWESYCKGVPASLCGGKMEYRVSVGRGNDRWPALVPKYHIKTIEVSARCESGKTVKCAVKVHFKSNHAKAFGEYYPEESVEGDTCEFTLASYSQRKTLKCHIPWVTASGARGVDVMDFRVSVTPLLTVGSVPPATVWQQTHGILREVASLPFLAEAHNRLRDEAIPNLAVSGLDHLQEVTINSLAYTRDLSRLREDAVKMIKTLKKVRSPRSWPDLWLSFRFGLRLFVNDTKEIVDAAKRYRKRKTFKGSIRRTHTSTVNSEVTPYGDKLIQRAGLTLYSDELSLSERSALHASSSLDVLPSLSNVWDFVPYSFVVDWLVPVGDLLERLDTSAAIWVYPIRSGVLTVRSELKVTLPPNWGGDLSYTLFTRSVYTQAQLSRRVQQLPSGMLSGLSIKHGIDTLCLAVQRFKR